MSPQLFLHLSRKENADNFSDSLYFFSISRKAGAKSKAKTDNSATNEESTLVVPKIETLAESQDEDNELEESNRKRKIISPELGGEKEKQVEKDGEDEIMKSVEDQETEQGEFFSRKPRFVGDRS